MSPCSKCIALLTPPSIAEYCFSKTLPDSTVVAPCLPWKAVYRQSCRNGRQFSHELPRNAEDNGLSNDDFRAKHSATVIGLKWRFCVDGKSSVMECNVWMGGAPAR